MTTRSAARGAAGALLLVASLCATGVVAAGTASASLSGVTTTVIPLPAGADPGAGLFLGGLDCPAVGSCVADSGYFPLSGGYGFAVSTLTGGVWTTSAIPLPDPATSLHWVQPGDVSCTVAGDCIATGVYQTASSTEAFAATETSGAWSTATALPVPKSYAATANDAALVACPRGADRCVLASSGNISGSPSITAIADTYVFGVGYAGPPIATPVPGSGLGSLTCPTAAHCLAAGGQVVAALDAGAWTVSPAPTDADGRATLALDRITCVEVGECAAIGVDTNFGPTVWMMHAGAWGARQQLAGPSSSASNIPSAVTSITCVAAVTDCTILGYSYDFTTGLVAQTVDGRWGELVAGPVTGAMLANTSLSFVSCPSPTTCVGVGTQFAASPKAIAATWSTSGSPPADAPTAVHVTGSSSSSLTVAWTEPSGAPDVRYAVRVAPSVAPPDASGSVVAMTASATAKATHLVPGHYRVTVQSIGPDGMGSAASAPATAYVPHLPGMPAVNHLTRHSRAVTVGWTAPSTYGGPSVTHYVVRLAGHGQVRAYGVAATVRTVTIGGLVAGARYSVTVTAWNSAGPGRPSGPSTFVAEP